MPAVLQSTALTVDVAPEDEPVSVEEAKRHLRILSDDFNGEVLDALAAAREWCESRINRTLRSSVTRTAAYSGWPRDPIRLPWPPLLSVVSVKYYDAEDADQTLAAANYRVHLSTDGLGHVEYDEDVTLPDVASRDDAVRIQFTTGYADGAIPPKAKQAILMKTAVLWGDMTGRDLGYTEKAANSLLDACDWGSYA